MRISSSVAFVSVIVCFSLPSELRAQQRAPVPDAQSQDTARKAVGQIYGGRFRQVKTTAEKTALATEMIEAAAKVQDGSADQYVLLKIASDVASGAGDAPTALRAVEKLAERFDVSAAKLIAETLLAAARNATTSSQQKSLGEAVLSMADAVADEDEFTLALSLCEAARTPLQKSRQYALAKDLTTKIEDLTKRQSEFEEYRNAWAVLDKNPTEPAANLAAGRYECFVKGDWDRGVAKLALGSDAALKDVAIKDLRGATTAEEQAAIGDGWWDLAEAEQGPERDMLRLRAGFWYRQAAPNLAGGLAGLKVKQRLAELDKAGRDVPADPGEADALPGANVRLQLPRGAVLLMTFEPGTFTSRDGKVYVADLSGHGHHGIVEGAAQVPAGRAGVGVQFGGQDSILLPTLHAGLTQGLKQLSLSVWVRQTDVRGDQMIFDVGHGADSAVALISREGAPVFALPQNHGGKVLPVSEKVETDQWYHIAGVWNGAEQRIYVNGQMKATVATQGLTLDGRTISAEPARIGAQAKAKFRSERYFRGVVDEIAIFARALSDDEVQTLVQFGVRGQPLVKPQGTRSVR